LLLYSGPKVAQRNEVDKTFARTSFSPATIFIEFESWLSNTIETAPVAESLLKIKYSLGGSFTVNR
jgi:hypothetical protein